MSQLILILLVRIRDLWWWGLQSLWGCRWYENRSTGDSRAKWYIVAIEENHSLYEVPSIKEYFQDLDYILGVISDGPAKSFAYRRLKYLESKYNMYTLLYEHQELADSKVSRPSDGHYLNSWLGRAYHIVTFTMFGKLIHTSIIQAAWIRNIFSASSKQSWRNILT